jgi:hypothetical protein
MAGSDEETLAGTGWELSVDEQAGELRLEHIDSGTTYIFDSEGNLRVPGDEDVGEELQTLQELLSSALAGSTEQTNQQTDTPCSIDCDDETGTLSIEAPTKIELEAPNIEIAADSTLDLSSMGDTTISTQANLALSSEATLSMRSAIHRAQSSGPLTLEGAIIELN